MKTPMLNAKVLNSVIGSVVSGFESEVFACKREDLERYWNFKYDTDKSPEVNLYLFHQSLGVYGRVCRNWEEHHFGICCVVERVRDTYLMPKIKSFVVAAASASARA